MSDLAHLWDRPIIQCAYRDILCGLGFLAENAPGDTTPPLFVCAAGFTVKQGDRHYSHCKKKMDISSSTKYPRTRDGVRKTSRQKKKDKPLWIAQGMGVYK